MAEKRSFIVYYDILEQLEDFTDEQVGKMFRAMVEYDKNGTIPNFNAEMKIAFKFIKVSLDKKKQEYLETCAKNSENARKRWGKQYATGCDRMRVDANDADNDNDTDTDTDNDNDNDNDLKKKVKKKKKFVPPTLEQVVEYAKIKKREDLAKKFYDYFTADEEKLWIDSEGKPVLNWKQKFLTWASRNPVNKNSGKQESFATHNYTKEQTNSVFDDIESVNI